MRLYLEPQTTQNQGLDNDWKDKRRHTQRAWFRYKVLIEKKWRKTRC